MADGSACLYCAAKTLTTEGAICQPWKLGASNNKNKRHKRNIFGRNHSTGTTMRPVNCPHPESKVSTSQGTQVMLKRLLKK